MRILLKSLIILLILQLSLCTFQDFKAEMEAKVKKLAESLQTVFASRCSTQQVRDCSTQSNNICKGTAERTCMADFPALNSCSGTSRFSLKSGVRIPNAFSTSSPSNAVKEFICTSAQQSFQTQLMSLIQQNVQSYSYSFFGSNSGAFRVSPGFRNDQKSENQCVDYDPRIRPWYVNQAYNRKNIVVMIETSASMGFNSGIKLTSAKNTLKALIKTLDYDDTISVVKFSDTAAEISSLTTLQRLTQNGGQKDALLATVDALTVDVSTDVNYQVAFELGLDIVKNTIDGSLSDCDQYLLVMIMGDQPNAGQLTAADLKTTIDAKILAAGTGFNVTLFGMDVSADTNVGSTLKDLTCDYLGIHFDLGDVSYESEFITKADGFYQYLAFGNKNTQALWSPIYQDAFGFGQLTTVAFPAYYNDGSQMRFLGIAGIDVLVSQFQTYESDISVIESRLARSKQCFIREIDGCQIQNLRGANTCATPTCTITDGTCGTAIATNDIFATPVDTTFTQCCDNEDTATQYSSFADFKAAMETKVQRMASKFSEVYPSRCGDSTIRECSKQTYNMCLGTATRSCLSDFPTPDTCLATGYWSQISTVRIPNAFSTSNMDQSLKDFICTTAQDNVENHLKAVHHQKVISHSFSFFGSTTGALRVTPGFKYDQTDTGSCVDYDPRLRPWYVEQAFKKKNVIILVQNSVTMGYDSAVRLATAKNSIKAIINTLDYDDFVNVIRFSNQSSSVLNKNFLQRITEDGGERDIVLAAVQSLTAGAKTQVNYQSALQMAFTVIQNTMNGASQPAVCDQYLILMFATNQPNDGQLTSADLQTTIDAKITAIGGSFNVSFFGFNVGSASSSLTVMNELACNYKGIYFNTPEITSQSQFLTQADGFYQYLAFGNQNSEPVWSKIYEDAFGFGQLVTVAFPAYYSDGTQRRLIGVAGIDVLVSQLKKYESNQTEIENLLSRQKECFVRMIDGCEIQNIRGTQTCGDVGCSLFDGQCVSSISTSANIFASPVDTSSEKCCDSLGGLGVDGQESTRVILLAVLIPIGVVLIVIGLGYWLYKGKHGNNQVANSQNRDLIPEKTFQESNRKQKKNLGELKTTAKYKQMLSEQKPGNDNSQAQLALEKEE